eukprot:2532133-Rhodomonas_salina.4
MAGLAAEKLALCVPATQRARGQTALAAEDTVSCWAAAAAESLKKHLGGVTDGRYGVVIARDTLLLPPAGAEGRHVWVHLPSCRSLLLQPSRGGGTGKLPAFSGLLPNTVLLKLLLARSS